ncbi:hypothetical protein CC1G_10445 [Coprinopsis cinerea okayama7|uniref:Uncharacterized protein n=1 Tax=Coprinopsis cinerea (strain Okayama-7 / 130 / ATCC MYA-4618 / FGSC 9003) TaxID=240176 RepID=A8PDT0_COPC7|nr:hypothetical protein CC1G_10445 [Coprinopsis cinerea okayama7\|eukprot:XP_001840659.2 hypothetical protein CC1G_10445 [Coprinopsis cinerea okayama7\
MSIAFEPSDSHSPFLTGGKAQVLGNQELLDIIFDFLATWGQPSQEDRHRILLVGLTCRHFFDPAMERLWRVMDDLWPLLNLLPEGFRSSREEARSYSLPLFSDRFLQYARCVRSVKIGDWTTQFPVYVYRELGEHMAKDDSPLGTGLLSRLRTVKVESCVEGAVACFPLLLPGRIETVHFEVNDPNVNIQWVSVCLVAAARYALYLKDFTVSLLHGIVYKEDPFGKTIPLPLLLFTSPDFKKATIQINARGAKYRFEVATPEEWDEMQFSASLTGWPNGWLALLSSLDTALLGSLELKATARGLSVVSDDPAWMEDISDLFSNESRRLRRLTVDMGKLVYDSPTILPVFQIRDLTHLSLTALLTESYEKDEEVNKFLDEILSNVSPNLRSLELLWPAGETPTSPFTLKSLLCLPRMKCNLDRLRITVACQTLPETDDAESESECRIRRLELDRCDTSNLSDDDIIQFAQRLLSSLQTVEVFQHVV